MPNHLPHPLTCPAPPRPTPPSPQVNTLTSANMFRPLGIDNAWDLEAFQQGFQIKINRVEEDVMEFDMIGRSELGGGEMRWAWG